jgi:hypothetical protein
MGVTSAGSSGYTWQTSEGLAWWTTVSSRLGGGGFDNSLKTKYDNGFNYLHGTGDINYIDRLYIYRGDSIAARTSLVNSSSTISEEINSPTFHAVNGYTFDGVSTYLNTHYNPLIDGVQYSAYNDAMFGCDRYGSSSEYGKFDLGITDGTTATAAALNTPGGVGWLLNNDTYNTFASNGDGIYLFKISGTNSVSVLANGNSSSTGNNASARPNGEIYVGCLNNVGTPANFKGVRTRFTIFAGGAINLSNVAYALNNYFLA